MRLPDPDTRGLLAAAVVVALVLLLGIPPWTGESPPARPVAGDAEPAYVGRAACRECHAAAESAWSGSDHDLALQAPGPATISADFDSALFVQTGTRTLFHRAGDRYLVTTPGPDGTPREFEVAYVFGHHPLEQFLLPLPGGRLQALTICWDTRPAARGGQRWYSLHPDDPPPPGDPFHWTGHLQNWNFMCAECHSTRLRRGYDADTDTYHTRWAEPDVSCEACHGPGSAHVAFERARERDPGVPDPEGRRGLVVDLGRDQQRSWVFTAGRATAAREGPPPRPVETEHCARCHSRRDQIQEEYRHGRPFGDHHRLTLLEESLYHANGSNRDEVFVLGSFLQTRMHAAGVTCTDCHDPHSGRTHAPGDQVCARCHRAEVYAAGSHHHHPAGRGDGCLDCHMRPVRVMGVDDRRDHGFRVPRPDLTLSLGVPNACNECHVEQDPLWARETVVRWYGPHTPAHFAPALHAGRRGAPGARDSLRTLIAAPRTPVIVRATALALLPRHGPASEEPLVVARLDDPDPLLRTEALRALVSSEPQRRLALALPRVDDPVRSVRLAAAEVLADLRPEQVSEKHRAALEAAHGIWREYLEAYQDRPEIRELLARFHTAQGRPEEARQIRARALSLRPGSPGKD